MSWFAITHVFMNFTWIRITTTQWALPLHTNLTKWLSKCEDSLQRAKKKTHSMIDEHIIKHDKEEIIDGTMEKEMNKWKEDERDKRNRNSYADEAFMEVEEWNASCHLGEERSKMSEEGSHHLLSIQCVLQ